MIGTVSASEFLIALTVSATFLVAMLSGHWQEAEAFAAYGTSIAGLVDGGMLAAPISGWMVKSIAPRALLTLVGCLVLFLAGYQSASLFGLF